MGRMDELRHLAEKHGLVGFGVCDVAPFANTRREMEARLGDGSAGRVRFTYKNPSRATDPTSSLPWIASLIVGAVAYLPQAGSQSGGSGRGRVARFATRDHYRPLRRGLAAIAEHLTAWGHRAEVVVDDDRLVDRAAAVRAGIGWWGKNTMVLAPKYGPWLLLGSVATDAQLAATKPMTRDCGSCSACLPACPTGALIAPGKLDSTLCISYWAQTPGVVPKPVRENWGDRLYGCDDCLEACPPGTQLLESTEGAEGVDLVALLAAPDEELVARYEHFYLPGRKTNTLRRNALLALAHVGGVGAESALRAYSDHPDASLAATAEWALARLGYSAEVDGSV